MGRKQWAMDAIAAWHKPNCDYSTSNPSGNNGSTAHTWRGAGWRDSLDWTGRNGYAAHRHDHANARGGREGSSA